MPPVICIVGKNKKYKTELMEALIRELKKAGLHVGALKYHKHGDFEMDIEGKDTWKYTNAGADTVAISSSIKFAIIKKVTREMGLDEICEKYFTGDDIVLADGFTLSDKPRIIAADNDEEIEIFSRGMPVIAIAGKAGTDDRGAIAKKITDYLMPGNKKTRHFQ